MIDTQTLQSITFEHTSRAAFVPIEVRPYETPAQMPCWHRTLVVGREHVLTGKDFTLIAGQSSGDALVTLQAVTLAPQDTLVVEQVSGCLSQSQSPERLRIKLEQPRQVFYVSPAGLLNLDADHAQFEGLPDAVCGTGPVKAVVRVADGSPYLEVKGEANQAALVLAPTPSSDDIDLFGTSGARFSRITVARQDEASGRQQAALQGEGTVKYPAYPAKGTVPISQDKVVKASDAVAHLQYDKKADRLWLSLSGRAGSFSGESLTGKTDYRLTLFDQLWYGHLPAALLTIAGWLAAVTIGALKLYKDFSR